MRQLLAAVTLLACLAGCRTRDADDVPDVLPAPATVPAPLRLTQPDVTEPPAPAPTAPNTYTSMTPPFMQHTPPRPRTLAGGPPVEATSPADSPPTAPPPEPPVTRTP